MCSARSSTGCTVIWASGLAHQLPDLLGGDRSRGLLDPGESAGASPDALDGGVLEVDVQHHLTLPAWPVQGRLHRPRLQVEGELVAGQVAGRDGAAHVQGLGGAGQQLLVGIGREGGVEVDRVGQVQVALGVHRARGARPGRGRRPSAGHPRRPAGRPRPARGRTGRSPPRPAGSAAPARSCAPPRATWASTNAAASGERHMVRSAIWASFHAGRSPASSRDQHSQSR